MGAIFAVMSQNLSATPEFLVVIGTRPEAIKLAPVIAEMQDRPGIAVRTLLTGQHRDMTSPVLEFFGLEASHDLAIMQDRQTPNDVIVGTIEGITPILLRESWQGVLVQGDTSSGLAAGLAAFNSSIPVYHVEAGLRSGSRENPFPEEMNRQLLSRLATHHFAPTERNRQNLEAEGIDPGAISVTGNTVIDALERITAAGTTERRRNHLLLTTHRRENLGAPMRRIFEAVGTILRNHPDVTVTYPLHPNPQIRSLAEEVLPDDPRLRIIEPLDYIRFVREMGCAGMILTDSGGVQEEAPALGVPVLVLRDTTEREEGIASGAALRVGTESEAIVGEVERLLRDDRFYSEMAQVRYPFGGAGGSRMIVDHLLKSPATSNTA